jgi:hypothetical protein
MDFSSMDLVRNVGDVAIHVIDEFEAFMFSAATAESNGFKSIWSMYGKIFVVAAASGATVGSLAFLEEIATGSKKGHGDDIVIGFLGAGLAAYGMLVRARCHARVCHDCIGL